MTGFRILRCGGDKHILSIHLPYANDLIFFMASQL